MGHDGSDGQDKGRAGADGDVVVCRHCAQALWREELWGWLHHDNSYLCRDPATGEVLFTPAEPATG